jgi:hypothetical protein
MSSVTSVPCKYNNKLFHKIRCRPLFSRGTRSFHIWITRILAHLDLNNSCQKRGHQYGYFLHSGSCKDIKYTVIYKSIIRKQAINKSLVLKCIVQAHWYIRNSDLHRDLRIETVTDINTILASFHKKIIQNHTNSEVSRFLNVKNIPRRLKRKKPFKLVKQ